MAQVDTSIYARNPLRSVADYEAELRNAELQKQGLAQNKLALQTGRLKIDEYQRGVERTNALQGILSKFGNDAQANTQALVTGGFLKEAEGYQKSQYEAEKAKAENVKAMVEVLGKKIDQHKGLLSTVANPQMAAQWMQAAYQDPDLGKIMSRLGPLEQVVSSIPQDPQGFQNWLLQTSAGADKLRGQLAQEAAAAETKANNLRTDARVKSEGAANRSVTMRGQDMTDARTRDITAVTKETQATAKRDEKVEKGVTKYSDTLQKEGIPELEAAVSGAEAVLNKYPAGQVPGIGAVKNALPAAAMSDEGKNVRQALAQVRNIVLSARSGAAVTDQELRRLVEEIGTGVGMSEDDIRNGLGRVRTRLETIKANTAAGVSDDVKSLYEERGGVKIQRGGATAPSGPKAGTVQDGYRFKGGDPADSKNWEKV